MNDPKTRLWASQYGSHYSNADPDVVTALLRVDAQEREWRRQGKIYQRATELLSEFPVLSGDGAWRMAEKGRAY